MDYEISSENGPVLLEAVNLPTVRDEEDAEDANIDAEATPLNNVGEGNDVNHVDGTDEDEDEDEYACDFFGLSAPSSFDLLRYPKFALAMLCTAATVQGFVCLG